MALLLYLEEKDDECMVDTIRSNSKTGRPCGDDGFMQTVGHGWQEAKGNA